MGKRYTTLYQSVGKQDFEIYQKFDYPVHQGELRAEPHSPPN